MPFENETSECPERNPEWPDELPEGPQEAAVVISVLWSVFFVASLALLYWRRTYSPIRARRVKLIAATTVGCFISTIPTIMREAVGRDVFPCTLMVFTATLTVPAVMCPIIQRVLHHKNRVEWQAMFMSRPLSQRSDDHIADMITQKYKASSRRAYRQVSMFASVFVLLVIIYQQVEPRYQSGECFGCEITPVEQILLLGIYAVVVLVMVYAIRRLPTTRAGQHDEIIGLINVLKVLSGFAVVWAVLYQTDPGNLHAHGVLTYAYLLEIGLTIVVIHQIWLPAYASFSSRDEDDTDSEVPIQDVLDSTVMRNCFETFLMQEFAGENLKFISEVQTWRAREPVNEQLPGHDKLMGEWVEAAADIYYTFVHDRALLQVNLHADVKEALRAIFEAVPPTDPARGDVEQPPTRQRKRQGTLGRSRRGLLKSSRSFRGFTSGAGGDGGDDGANPAGARPMPDPKELSSDVFEAAVREIKKLLEMDNYPRFIRSAAFKEMRLANHTPQKGHVIAGGASFISDISTVSFATK